MANFERGAGVLLHISSLPSSYGIGTFGASAFEFVDFLHKAGQKYWQVLPLNQLSYGDSPYQSPSAFAGNPYFVDLDILISEGLLTKQECDACDFGGSEEYVDYGKLYQNRFPLLRLAYSRFCTNDSKFLDFCTVQSYWLDNYACFMTLKEHNNNCGLKDWSERDKTSTLDQAFFEENKDRINFWRFVQYKFFSQWQSLHDYANSQNISIIGDMPIYVAFDSAEVRFESKYFELDDKLSPTFVAGVPPDYFSSDGQLWGNPLYDWKQHGRDNFAWWKKRLNFALTLYDCVRIDHFRGFSAYYRIPAVNTTAKGGHWVKGLGKELFKEVNKAIPNAKILAEDLGDIDEDTRELLAYTGYPGMKVLQFCFDGNPDNPFLPKNCVENSIVYTGTHDNDTSQGFYDGASESLKLMINKVCKKRKNQSAALSMIKTVLSTKSNIAIIPIQDYLELGSDKRMNTPSTTGNDNWRFRLRIDSLTDTLAVKINQLSKKSDR